jgi:hypothetical protein
MTLWFLHELCALRGETNFFIKCKEFTVKTLSGFGISNLGHCNLFAICDLFFGIYIHSLSHQYNIDHLRPINKNINPNTCTR